MTFNAEIVALGDIAGAEGSVIAPRGHLLHSSYSKMLPPLGFKGALLTLFMLVNTSLTWAETASTTPAVVHSKVDSRPHPLSLEGPKLSFDDVSQKHHDLSQLTKLFTII